MKQVVLITGAARRIGAEIACHLHEKGADVMLHYRSSQANAEALADQLNRRRADSAATHQADLLTLSGLTAMVEATVARFGALTALVNSASSFFKTPIGTIEQSEWDDLMGTNLKAPLFLSQTAIQFLRAHQGCIVNITDIHAERPLKNHALYCAAKAGLMGLTRALAVDLAPDVRVNAVAPGTIEWPATEDSFPMPDRRRIVDSTLLKRVGAPLDIARAVGYLIFDAPYVTGQILNVDGGRTISL